MHKCQIQPGPKLEYYSVKAAAAYLAIGTTTVYKAIERRQIKHACFGKSIRISHDNLTRWVEEQTKPTLAELKAKGYSYQHKGQPIRKAKIGRPPTWPPQTDAALRTLAKRIEQKMIKQRELLLTKSY